MPYAVIKDNILLGWRNYRMDIEDVYFYNEEEVSKLTNLGAKTFELDYESNLIWTKPEEEVEIVNAALREREAEEAKKEFLETGSKKLNELELNVEDLTLLLAEMICEE